MNSFHMTYAIIAQSKPQRQVPLSHTSQERIEPNSGLLAYTKSLVPARVRKYSNKIAYQTSSHNELSGIRP